MAERNDPNNAEPDLLGFDVAPVPAPAPAPFATSTNDDFGAFQSTATATTASSGGSDDFAAFSDMRSFSAAVPVQSTSDPFAVPAPALAPPPQQQAAFGAFGNNNNLMATAGNPGMPMPGMMTNNAMGGMDNVTNSFGNMNVTQGVGVAGMLPQQPQQVVMPPNDDDFGDFTGASKMASSVGGGMTMMGGPSKPSSSSGDPLSKLINLDGLSKNPSRNIKPGNMNRPVVANPSGNQYQQHMQQQGIQPSCTSEPWHSLVFCHETISISRSHS